MRSIFKNKVSLKLKYAFTREILVRLSHKIPRTGTAIVKIEDK
jgi:hypothetical protein